MPTSTASVLPVTVTSQKCKLSEIEKAVGTKHDSTKEYEVSRTNRPEELKTRRIIDIQSEKPRMKLDQCLDFDCESEAQI